MIERNLYKNLFSQKETSLIGLCFLHWSWLETVISISIEAIEKRPNRLDPTISKINFSKKLKRLRKSILQATLDEERKQSLENICSRLDNLSKQRNALSHCSIILFSDTKKLIKLKDLDDVCFDEEKLTSLLEDILDTGTYLAEILNQEGLLQIRR